MTLIEFLRARLDEDERWALTAAGPIGDHWQADGGSICAEHPTDAIVDHAGQASEHIARHDPARVLAEVDAKRRIIAEFEFHDERVRWALAAELSPAHPDERRRSVWQVLRLLASVYADHPDYNPEWAWRTTTGRTQSSGQVCPG